GHAADLVEVDAGLAAQEVDGGGQRLGVALAPAGVDGGQHALVAADGGAHLHGRRGDAEDQHGAAPPVSASGPVPSPPASAGATAHGASASSSDTWRAAQLGPTGRTRMRRSSSPSPGSP